MHATPAKSIPCGDDWTFELKYDGFRRKSYDAIAVANRVLLLLRVLHPRADQSFSGALAGKLSPYTAWGW
jgi:hypothetical protein